ncbi:MAG: hypothetical protein EBV20_09765 [Betaproteobacteria bacterium]|nr:hypothetical protein [Betaproteobacteria bacterium]NBP45564.1 hypothetical protein [Betaproteobacteria bacterium]
MASRARQAAATGSEPTQSQGWSCNFMSDALWSGRRFRTFNVIEGASTQLFSADAPDLILGVAVRVLQLQP